MCRHLFHIQQTAGFEQAHNLFKRRQLANIAIANVNVIALAVAQRVRFGIALLNLDNRNRAVIRVNLLILNEHTWMHIATNYCVH